MTTISGTAVTPTSSITAQNLIDRAQNALSDAPGTTWSETIILEWLNEAIRAYSRHFKRTRETTLTAVADTRAYNLPSDFFGPLNIEYPTGETTPAYLDRGYYLADDFHTRSLYDIIPTDTPQLYLSLLPKAGETISIRYHADHDYALASTDLLTVHSRHHDMLILHIIWSARRELLSQAEQDGDRSSLDIGALADDANDALKDWMLAMEEGNCESSSSVLVTGHTADSFDRIY